MAKAAVEMGMWALAAEQRGVSLACPARRDSNQVEVGISLGIQASPGALVERARARAGGGLPQGEAQDRAGRGCRVCPGGSRRAGARRRRSWPTPTTPIPWLTAEPLPRAGRAGLMMIEQPLAWDDLRQHAELQRRLRTPHLPGRVDHLARAGPGDGRAGERADRSTSSRDGSAGSGVASRSTTSAPPTGSRSGAAGCWRAAWAGRYNVALASLPNFPSRVTSRPARGTGSGTWSRPSGPCRTAW